MDNASPQVKNKYYYKHSPGFEAVFFDDDTAMIQYDGRRICSVDLRSNKILFDYDHSVHSVSKSLMPKTVLTKAFLDAQEHVNNFMPEILEGRSKFIDAINEEFTTNGIYVPEYEADTRPCTAAYLSVRDEGIEDLYKRSGFEAELGCPYEKLKDKGIKPQVLFQSFFQDNSIALEVIIKDPKDENIFISKPVNISCSEQRFLDKLEKICLGQRSTEDLIAKSVRKGSIYFSLLKKMPEKGDEKTLVFKPEYDTPTLMELLRRANAADKIDINDFNKNIGSAHTELSYIRNGDKIDTRLEIISDKVKTPIAVPITDKEKFAMYHLTYQILEEHIENILPAKKDTKAEKGTSRPAKRKQNNSKKVLSIKKDKELIEAAYKQTDIEDMMGRSLDGLISHGIKPEVWCFSDNKNNTINSFLVLTSPDGIPFVQKELDIYDDSIKAFFESKNDPQNRKPRKTKTVPPKK